MFNNTRIVIADDMEPILLYLEKVISDEPEFEVVGKANNGNELIELVKQHKPELIITDEEMPECGGIQAVEELNKLGIKTKCILVTGNENCIITSKARDVGILKVIKKPILDDKKFIAQIKEVISLESKIDEKRNITDKNKHFQSNQVKNQNIIKRIINKIFKSK